MPTRIQHTTDKRTTTASGARTTNPRAKNGNVRPRRRGSRRSSKPHGPAQAKVDPQAKPAEVSGVLELHPQGYGFLRDPHHDYRAADTDAFVSAGLITKLGLRQGSLVTGQARQATNRRGPRLEEVHDIDGLSPETYASTKPFDALTAINPDSWLRLETPDGPLSSRVIDMLAPLGKGQRGVIVAPPRSGKTVLLEQIANAVAANHPDVKIFVLLVDERPEEVTDMRRNIRGEVLASSLDRDVEGHVRLSQLVVDRCRRLAESGHDVLLLIDSLTRMARAFNKWVGNSGRTMSGGVDIRALDIPKKLFATARAFEEGGSLTILATALVETGSRMDDVIFEEFKGTGNMELVLDRRLADRRVWPAIDITRSGTRREEKLLDANTLHTATVLRRTLSSMEPVDAMQQLTTQMSKFKSNKEFMAMIHGTLGKSC